MGIRILSQSHIFFVENSFKHHCLVYCDLKNFGVKRVLLHVCDLPGAMPKLLLAEGSCQGICIL